MRRTGVIAGELRRLLERLAKAPYTPKRDDVRALAEFVRAARRAAFEEATALLRGTRASALDEGEIEAGDLRNVQAAFSSAIYGMATSPAPLRDRVAMALADLVPRMADCKIADETTALGWEALVAPLSSRPLREAIAALSDGDVDRIAASICKIDARLRWLIR